LSNTPTANPSRIFALLELVRLPNVFTAAADVAMGCLFVLGAFGTWNADKFLIFGMLTLVSCLMYSGGMVLNDVFDYDVDVKERPERPLPSGRISVNFAQFFGFELLLIGTALGWTVSYLSNAILPGLIATLLAVAVLLYDVVLKPTVAAPLAMGGCRFLNVLLGMSVLAGGEFEQAHYLIAGGIGVYILGLTIFARQEAETSNRAILAVGTLVMLVGIGMIAAMAELSPERLIPALQLRMLSWYFFWVVVAVLTVWRCARAIMRPHPIWVQMAVKNGILSLIVLDAAIVYSVCGLPSAVIVLSLLVPMVILGKWIYST
jgi:4-hydroxybenzoate polyprenyltransferase